jgi:hypothetical protein
MVPPPGDWWVVVDRDRKVAGEVFFKKGHMPLDWRSRASMMSTKVSKSATGAWKRAQ